MWQCFIIHCPTTYMLTKTHPQNVSSEFFETEVKCSLFISILSHIIGFRRRGQNSSSCLIFLSQFSCYACSVRWILSSSLSPGPRVPSHWRGTISAQIQSEMNLGFIKRKASYKEGEKKVPQTWRDKLSYNGFSPVSLQSLSCIRAWGLWWLGVILQCVGRVWMCQGYQGRHPFVKSSRWQRLEKNWLRWRFQLGNKV